MVMSGEGADEMFGGYLYSHKAPNAEEFHAENVAKLLDLCAQSHAHTRARARSRELSAAKR